jgi:hypothetical protein
LSEKEIGVKGEIRIGEIQSFTSNVNALQVKEKPLLVAINALDKGLAKTSVLQQFHFRVD